MTVLRIFVSYEVTDAAFATRLMTDLRDAGAEVITDSTGLPDNTFEQFLTEELLHCQYLIVVQTLEAFQSPRMQTVVDTALTYVQQDQLTRLLRVIAPSLNASEAQEVTPIWAMIPSFDARQDYPRALVGLLLELGLPYPYDIPDAPPPIFQGSRQKSPHPTLFSPNRVQFSFRKIFSTHQPRSRLWLAAFTMILLLIVIVASFVANGRATPQSASHTIATSTRNSQATPIPTHTPDWSEELYTRVTSKTPIIDDELRSQNDNEWLQGLDVVRGRCWFTGGAYHVWASTRYTPRYTTCPALAEKDRHFDNFALQVEMVNIVGDGGGVLFRSSQLSAYYTFTLCFSSSCIQGTYKLHKWQKGYNGQPDDSASLAVGYSRAIMIGPSQTNLLTVIAQGSEIYLYINKQFVNEIHDTTFISGEIGVTAVDFSNPTEVAFKNLEVWQL